ncbi:MAG TPA: 23S rRNA (guanosine(2251)-2'-O)-methyltransferase RlmB [Saprospiraceae bacterium]|nr:23S rRNA (guanosine(2251)-2'-O)-methyltransferase RlmB [Saprospiraceae bacterium]
MKKERDPMIAGRHPVIEALKNNAPVDKVMFQKGIRGEYEKELRWLCRSRNIPLQIVPKEKLGKLYGGNHQGVLAIGTEVVYQSLADVLPHLYEQGLTPKIVVLDGITDVRNFGAIARSAEIFGIHAIVISAKNGASANSFAVKTSAGALLRIPVCREKSLAQAFKILKDHGVSLIGTDLAAKKTIREIDWNRPVAIIMGAEGTGIGSATKRELDETCIIPQVGQTDSLNVSVAAGIIFYESIR